MIVGVVLDGSVTRTLLVLERVVMIENLVTPGGSSFSHGFGLSILLLQFTDLNVPPLDVKWALIGSDPVNLQSDESGVVRERVGDVFDQFPIDPSLDSFPLSPDMVLVPFVVFEMRVGRLRRRDPIAAGGFTINVPRLAGARFNFDLRAMHSTIVLVGEALGADLYS